MEKVIISGGTETAPINMRKAASRSSTPIAEIPQGSEAELLEGGGTWNQIKWNGITGYVMSVFVQRAEGSGEQVSISKAELEAIYDKIGDWLGLRG